MNFHCTVNKPVSLPLPSAQVWFQNCRARHKKHVSPNHSSAAPVSSLQSAQLSPPLIDELQYTAFAPVDNPMLTALHSYMDGTFLSWNINCIQLDSASLI